MVEKEETRGTPTGCALAVALASAGRDTLRTRPVERDSDIIIVGGVDCSTKDAARGQTLRCRTGEICGTMEAR